MSDDKKKNFYCFIIFVVAFSGGFFAKTTFDFFSLSELRDNLTKVQQSNSLLASELAKATKENRKLTTELETSRKLVNRSREEIEDLSRISQESFGYIEQLDKLYEELKREISVITGK